MMCKLNAKPTVLANDGRTLESRRHLTIHVIPLLITLVSALQAGGETPMMDDRKAEQIDLSGEWRFSLDPDDCGEEKQWFKRQLEDTVVLPGTTATNEKGARHQMPEPGKLTRRYHYIGAAWYQKSVTIPENWAGKRIILFLERCHWVSRVWLDNMPVGMGTSLSTPHVYDLTGMATPGSHTVTVRIDNRHYARIGGMQLMSDAQLNWNGIIGRILLEATAPVWVDSVQVYPNVQEGTAKVLAQIATNTDAQAKGTLTCEVIDGNTVVAKAAPSISMDGVKTPAECDITMPRDFEVWDEFSPKTYTLRVTLRIGPHVHSRSVSFGMRKLTASGRQFELNGRPLLLRGHVDCNIWPDRGHPPMEEDAWLEIMCTLQDYGMNHIRFHSGCPPEACFAAADETGVILQIENPAWYDPKYAGGSVGGDSKRSAFLQAEMDAILSAYGNHPSFCLYAMGNELGPVAEPFQMALVAHGQAIDPRHMYTRNSGYMNLDAPQDYFVASYSPTTGHLRLQWLINDERPGTCADYWESIEPIDKPLVSHEIAMWNMTANLDEWKDYHGAMAPLFLKDYRTNMENAGLLDMAEPFRQASGAFLLEIWKEEIERQLRTPQKAGFQLLSLYDYPGFGVSLNGILDCLWRSKGLIKPEAFRQFCGPVVPLLRMPKRVWQSGETLQAGVQVANYGPRQLPNVPLRWTLRDAEGERLAGGDLGRHSIPNTGLQNVGAFELDLSGLASPGQYLVKIELVDTVWRNAWRIWVLAPEDEPAPAPELHIAREWNEETRAILTEGGRVMLFLQSEDVYNAIDGIFAPVFAGWQQLNAQPGTFGIYCDPAHPALTRFPTESHSDWQWWDLMNNSAPLILDAASPDVSPIVHVIDNHDRSHRLALLFECRVGKGALLATTVDLHSDMKNRPAARQFRESILHYAASDSFEPSAATSFDMLDKLFRKAPRWLEEELPDPDGAVALDVRAAKGMKKLNYPAGQNAWVADLDDVIHKAPGFDYSATACNMHCEPRLGLHGWRNRWRSYPLQIDVTCPLDFDGDIFLQLLNREQRQTPVRVVVGGSPAQPADFQGHDGRWYRCPIPRERDTSKPLRIELLGQDAYVWVTRMVVCPSRRGQ